MQIFQNVNSCNKVNLCLLVIVITLFNQCAPGPSDADTRKKIAADFPKVDGSTSTHPLEVKLACDMFGVPFAWSDEKRSGVERTIVPDEKENIPGPILQTIKGIKHATTHDAYVNVIEGKSDLGLLARLPSADEEALVRERGIELDIAPVALDAFVFLAHVRNPVATVSIAQIRDIYSGRIGAWGALGIRVVPGSTGDERLVAYQRERNSGSQELLMSLVMKDLPVIDAPSLIVKKMPGPFHAIGGDKFDSSDGDIFGFAYSVYYYSAYMFSHSSVKIIAVEGVAPTPESIARRLYPLVAEVYLVTRKNMPKDSTAILYRNWMLGPYGQKAIAESGFIPVAG